jgi:phage shock protein A
MEDVSRSIERAEERTEDMEARAAALDELQETGALESQISDKDSLDRELEELATDSAVDAELETLKSEMGKGEATSESEDEADVEVEPEPDPEAVEEAEPPEVDDSEVERELEDLKDKEAE